MLTLMTLTTMHSELSTGNYDALVIATEPKKSHNTRKYHDLLYTIITS